MPFAPLLMQAPRKPYPTGLLKALAETQDRAFAEDPEGWVGHVNDWESKLPNRAFYLVAGTHRYLDGRRATKHCTTFQAKDDALAFAQRWRLNCPTDDIRVLVSGVDWHEFTPSSKADAAAVAKIAGVDGEDRAPGPPDRSLGSSTAADGCPGPRDATGPLSAPATVAGGG